MPSWKPRQRVLQEFVLLEVLRGWRGDIHNRDISRGSAVLSSEAIRIPSSRAARYPALPPRAPRPPATEVTHEVAAGSGKTSRDEHFCCMKCPH